MDIVDYIPFGRENAVTRAQLRSRTGIDDRAIRDMIAAARRDTVILNMQDGKGYFRPLPEEINYVKNFCMKAKYLVINSDIEINCSILKEIKTNIITYGLNHKSTVTLSSITDESVLIFVQREFENMENKAIEVGEYNIKIQKENRTNIHEIMLAFILNNLNNIKIMDENETK